MSVAWSKANLIIDLKLGSSEFDSEIRVKFFWNWIRKIKLLIAQINLQIGKNPCSENTFTDNNKQINDWIIYSEDDRF